MRLFEIALCSGAMAMVGCGAPQSGTEQGQSAELAFQEEPSPNAPYCPEGTTYLASHRLCVTDKDAYGPFTSDMIEKCIRFGGGESVCRSNKWGRDFAKKLRGTERCMPGATWSSSAGLCVVGDVAYGPFSRSQVERCRTKEGGAACETMRVHKWHLLETPDPYQSARNYIRITRQGWYLYGGLYALKLELLRHDGMPLGNMYTVSGQDYAQSFRKAPQSERGSYEPLPEGLWKVRYPSKGTGGNEWADGVGNFDGYMGDGLGPTFQEIVMYESYQTERTAIGVHLDSNRDQAPGTAGCVGISSKSDLRRYISWFENEELAPRTLVVDWGLGTIPATFGEPNYLRSLTNFGLEDAYIPLMERIKVVESGFQ